MSHAHRPGVAAARATGETDGAGAVTPLRSVAVRLWAAPASLLGLALAVPWLALGGRMARRDGVLEITAPLQPHRLLWPIRPGVHRRRAVLFDAITFGHVVLARSAAAHDALRTHERVHVRQYEAWGAFFLVAYPAESLLQWARGRRAYLDNRFEVEARRLASP